jgi:hypothetical protein
MLSMIASPIRTSHAIPSQIFRKGDARMERWRFMRRFALRKIRRAERKARAGHTVQTGGIAGAGCWHQDGQIEFHSRKIRMREG